MNSAILSVVMCSLANISLSPHARHHCLPSSSVRPASCGTGLAVSRLSHLCLLASSRKQWQNSSFLWLNTAPLCVRHIFFTHLSSFCFGGYRSCCRKHSVGVFPSTMGVLSCGFRARRGIAGGSVFNFCRHFPTVFCNGCTNVPSH